MNSTQIEAAANIVKKIEQSFAGIVSVSLADMNSGCVDCVVVYWGVQHTFIIDIDGHTLRQCKLAVCLFALNRLLKSARVKVNNLEFGSDAWEAAMQAVRAIVELHNSVTDFGNHVSIDGGV